MPNLREALEAGYDELAGETATEPAQPTEPVTTGAAGHDEPVAPAVVGAEPADDRPRGPDGKFVKAEKAPEAPKEAKPTTPPGQAAAPVPTSPQPTAGAAPVSPGQLASDKAPASWRALAREQWAALPTDVKQEWARREKEMAGWVAKNKDAQELYGRFQETIRPYQDLIASSGNDALHSVANLMDTAARLQRGTPDEVATIAAQIIQGYGVQRFGPQFVDAVAARLNGTPIPQSAGQPSSTLTREDINRILEERFQGMQQTALENKAKTELEKFEESPPEFYDHPGIKQRMARILEANDEEGVALTYQEAYDLAVASHQEIKKVLEQRAAAKNVASAQANAQRVKAAAGSVRTQPTAADAAQPAGRRAALEAGYDEIASR